MNQAEIEAKIVELALLYEQQRADSVAAQKLVEDLAKENAQNVGRARLSLGRKIMLKKVTVKQGKNDVAVDIKSATVSQVMKAIESARGVVADTQTMTAGKATTVKNKSNDMEQLETLMANAEKAEETESLKPAEKQKMAGKSKEKPATPAEKDESQVKPTKTENETVNFPDKKTQADIKEFFKPDSDDYSDALADYMENKENALKMLNFLYDKYTKYSGPLNSKIMCLALTAYSVNGKDADIAGSVKSLIEKFSELSIEKYIEKNKKAEKVFFKDPFLSDVKANTNPDCSDLLNGITERHVQNVLGRLPEEDKVKYLRSLSKKNGLEQYNPREQNKKVAPNDEEKNIKPTQQEKQIGDTIMADEVKLTSEQIEELKKYNKDIDLSGVTPENYAEKLAALKKEAEENAGAEVKSDGKDEVSKDGEDSKAKEGEEKVADEKGKGNLSIDGEGGKKPEPKINTDYDWIERKKADYQDRFEKKEIAGYQWDETVKEGFAAHVEGGYIHYTCEDHVIVSKESGLKVFEALVTEKDNKGRPVNFGENLEHDQAVKLLAACLIHGNEIGTNPPKLSEADMKLLEAELQGRTTTVDGKEVSLYEFIKPQLEKYAEGREDKKENADTNEAEPKAFDDETKAQIKEAMNNQYEMAAMESSGKIDENKEKYDELKSKQADDKKLLAEKFIENPEGVRALMKELVNEKTGKSETKDVIAAHRDIVKLKMEVKKEEGAKDADKQFIIERRKQQQEEMAIALGIKEPTGDKKALEGDALKEYISKNNISQFTYTRLLAKENEGKAPDQQKKTNDDVYNMCNKTSAILTKNKENGGK